MSSVYRKVSKVVCKYANTNLSAPQDSSFPMGVIPYGFLLFKRRRIICLHRKILTKKAFHRSARMQLRTAPTISCQISSYFTEFDQDCAKFIFINIMQWIHAVFHMLVHIFAINYLKNLNSNFLCQILQVFS